jgi:hypothetical protein
MILIILVLQVVQLVIVSISLVEVRKFTRKYYKRKNRTVSNRVHIKDKPAIEQTVLAFEEAERAGA